MTERAYLDHASTAPLHPAARDALLAALDAGWGDPARLYGTARRARRALDEARESVAHDLGARPDEVWFTASGTQAAHLAVLGIAGGRRRSGRDVVVSAVEHSAVLHAAQRAAADGGGVRIAPVDSAGRVTPEAYAEQLSPTASVACLQSANHEVGTVQPVEQVAELCAAAGVPLVVDAAQSVAHLGPPPGWSALVASGHKWGGPAGLGVLAVRTGTRWAAPLPEDDRGRVPGFPNVPAAVAAAVALRAARAEATELVPRLQRLRDRLAAELPAAVGDCTVLGAPAIGLPHLLAVSLLYVDGESLLSELDRAGVDASSGSSCTSSTLEPSHVLVAMGVLTHGNLRLSLGRTSTDADVDHLLTVLPAVVAAVRAASGAADL